MSLSPSMSFDYLAATTPPGVSAGAVTAAIAAHAATVASPLVFGIPATVLADAALAANQISFWMNDGSNLLAFKLKNSTGVVKTGTVALT